MTPAEIQQYTVRIQAASHADEWGALDREIRAKFDVNAPEVHELIRAIERASGPLMRKATMRAMTEGTFHAFRQRLAQQRGGVLPTEFTFSDAMADVDMSAFIRQVEAEEQERDQYRGSPMYEQYVRRLNDAADMDALETAWTEIEENEVLGDEELDRLSRLYGDRVATVAVNEEQALEDRVGTERLREIAPAFDSEDENVRAQAAADLYALQRGEDVPARGPQMAAPVMPFPNTAADLRTRLLRQLLSAEELAALEQSEPAIKDAVEGMVEQGVQLVQRAAEIARRTRGR